MAHPPPPQALWSSLLLPSQEGEEGPPVVIVAQTGQILPQSLDSLPLAPLQTPMCPPIPHVPTAPPTKSPLILISHVSPSTHLCWVTMSISGLTTRLAVTDSAIRDNVYQWLVHSLSRTLIILHPLLPSVPIHW